MLMHCRCFKDISRNVSKFTVILWQKQQKNGTFFYYYFKNGSFMKEQFYKQIIVMQLYCFSFSLDWSFMLQVFFLHFSVVSEDCSLLYHLLILAIMLQAHKFVKTHGKEFRPKRLRDMSFGKETIIIERSEY